MTTINKNNSQAPRDFIGKALISLKDKGYPITVIDADLASSTRADQFAKKYPKHFFEMGIAEASSMSFAIGQALEGQIPFFVDFAIFVTGTAWTQLRQACYTNANIKLVGTHPGMDDGPDGASHHALEDIALTRVLPNLTVLTPADAEEIEIAFEEAIKIKGPVYIRTAREPMPVRDKSAVPIVKDIGIIENSGDDFAILFEGSSYEQALDGYNLTTGSGKKGKLIHIARVKPFNTKKFIELCKNVKAIMTVENHSINGGIGGLIAEQALENSCFIPLVRIGTQDTFTESGNSRKLKEKYGLCGQNIYNKLMEIL